MYIDDKYNVRIILQKKIEFTKENGYALTITGKTLDFYLDNRIVWNQSNYIDRNSVDIIEDLVKNNACYEYAGDTRGIIDKVRILGGGITNVTAQYRTQRLTEVLKDLCEQANSGYRVVKRYHYQDERDEFFLELYNGYDRTINNPNYIMPVVFDTRLGNVINYSVTYNGDNYKNSALILGEGDGISKIEESVGTEQGRSRFEMYINANDLSQNTGTAQAITLSNYRKMLKENANKYLQNQDIVRTLEVTIDSNYYKFKADYDLGDLCTVITPLFTANYRIIEVTESWSDNGYTVELNLQEEREW